MAKTFGNSGVSLHAIRRNFERHRTWFLSREKHEFCEVPGCRSHAEHVQVIAPILTADGLPAMHELNLRGVCAQHWGAGN